MKRSDLAMIVFIASVSVLVAYFVGNSIFGNITNAGEKVKTIAPISTTIVAPDPTIFNKNAINPSVEVQITSTTSSDTSTTGTQ
ncbi:MAG: exported protein of unknown function [Candidatus Saccharibacteria bacterium]|nr:exported protein of unknown function [Candidatus Saccharibacteria bacterium]